MTYIKNILNKIFVFLGLESADDTPEGTEKQIKKLTFLMVFLIVFACIYVFTSLFVVKNEVSKISTQKYSVYHPLMPLNLSQLSTNLFAFTNNNIINKISPEFVVEFSQPAEYEVGDIVVVRYFNIIGVVSEKSFPSGNTVRIIYKNHDHDLLEINLRKEFLLKPSTDLLNPFSILDILHQP